jgi:hypothetical protein
MGYQWLGRHYFVVRLGGKVGGSDLSFATCLDDEELEMI